MSDRNPSPSPEVWPPSYTVRRSAKARHARLRVQPGTGLEIVIPQGMKSLNVEAVLENHKEWVLRALARVFGPVAPASPALPGSPDGTASLVGTGNAADLSSITMLSLHGGLLRVPLTFEGTRSASVERIPLPDFTKESPCYPARLLATVSQPYTLPVFTLPGGNQERRSAFARNLVRSYARRFLGAWLSQCSRESGLIPSSYTVRLQKSRWGSCTCRGGLNLNLSLVFLPFAQCRHILLHELCHLRHMDHSDAFWKLLFQLEPDALEQDAKLRHAWRYVPAWIWEK
ncbi:M48 family metallopeptidase [Desulfovibrio sp. OttesenSCG-928-I05]|nr:M48 family metallopeptidase [Desulfovibrio sp. OttesenSCG-928-I05]